MSYGQNREAARFLFILKSYGLFFDYCLNFDFRMIFLINVIKKNQKKSFKSY
jgi:hypothetical protein